MMVGLEFGAPIVRELTPRQRVARKKARQQQKLSRRINRDHAARMKSHKR